MKKILTVLLFVSYISLVFTQTKVSGVVQDEFGNPLPGANVVEKGTTNGTLTDLNGNYELELEQVEGVELEYSFVGYEKKVINEITSIINVSLKEGLILEEVTIIGSRNKNRTATNTVSPVDLLDIQELKIVSPQVTITEILNYAAPSFTSNPQSISDGTDHIAPASLRGLGPDQVLVLINGKRRHKTSLVNVNGTFGRGSVGTDFSTIPAASIQRIEILRDGAAAQYGSDAIAGVINIVLNKSVDKLSVNLTTGANFTKEISPDKSIDGEKFNLGVNYGLPVGKEGGFINFTGEFNFRGRTNRMKAWEGKIFNRFNTIERFANNEKYPLIKLLDDDVNDVIRFAEKAKIDLKGATTKEELRKILGVDATESELAARGLKRSDFNMRVGQSELRSATFFANSEVPLGENLKLYANGGLTFKNGNAAGFYRLPNQSRAFTSAKINGFLPEINSNILDKSYTIGINGVIGQWTVDFSNTWGKNSIQYGVTNSLNASLQNSTPFEANSGGFFSSENTTNIDVNRYFEDILTGINIAFGVEYRLENYGIFAGEEASYAQYNTKGQVHDPTDSLSVVPTDFFGSSRPGGIQVFPGFKPDNEVNAYRNSVAAYVDAEVDFTKFLTATSALRYENFSDFGSTLNTKIGIRINPSENTGIRLGFQTGFRAPSLHQIHYSSTSTLFVDGVPNEVGVFSNTSRVARLLGIDELKEENSLGGTGGFTANIPSANLKFTIDGYLVYIDDRVILTGQFNHNNNPELKRLFAQANATKAAFFANTVNTRTQGLNFVVDHNIDLSSNIKLTNTLALTLGETSVREVNIPDAIKNAGLSDTYFDKTSRLFIEKAVPRTKGNLTNLITFGDKWSVFLRNLYFGEVQEATNNKDPKVDSTYSAKVITDLSIGYNFNTNLRLTIGSNNIFDIYPDIAHPEFQSSGRFRYSRRSTQFGTGGRHIFARLLLILQ